MRPSPQGFKKLLFEDGERRDLADPVKVVFDESLFRIDVLLKLRDQRRRPGHALNGKMFLNEDVVQHPIVLQRLQQFLMRERVIGIADK